eukprot:6212477-Pleurochrysis_carterae.AAC.3
MMMIITLGTLLKRIETGADIAAVVPRLHCQPLPIRRKCTRQLMPLSMGSRSPLSNPACVHLVNTALDPLSFVARDALKTDLHWRLGLATMCNNTRRTSS